MWNFVRFISIYTIEILTFQKFLNSQLKLFDFKFCIEICEKKQKKHLKIEELVPKMPMGYIISFQFSTNNITFLLKRADNIIN